MPKFTERPHKRPPSAVQAPMTIDFEHAYRAVTERDGTQDGRFVTAVRTTGVYCRPSCPARTPLARNVTFFATADEARAAGYRACRRCHP
jgi:AraC family transcriptional regulator, regulatory protein of adaptative response / DNA-3-methyladenine glycosylase II